MTSLPVYSCMGYALATDHSFATPMALADSPPDLELIVGEAPWPVPDGDAAATWQSDRLLDSGRAVESVHLISDTRTLYRFGEVLDFHLEPERVTAVILDPTYAFMLEIRLLGPVISLMHELAGRPVLHGSAVVLDDGTATGFLSQNGGGKTTVAAGFLRRGSPLLSDDLLALDQQGDRVFSAHGYPQMRMWPHAAANFIDSPEGLALVHPDLEKRRVPIGPDGLASFHPRPAPLRVIYELNREPVDTFSLKVTELRGTERLMTLVRHCFLGALVHGIGLGPDRFRRLAKVTERVPVCRVDYSGTLDDLDRVCDELAAFSRP